LAAEQTLALGSRVSTALTLGAKPAAALGGFERLAIDDGERAASGIDAARVVTLKFGRSWGVAPALLAAAAALGALVPAADWRSSNATISVASTEQRAEAADAIAQAAATVREVSGGDAPMATTRDLGTLEELERELTEGRADPRAARARAAESVESAASRLERQAQERMEADRALRDRLARAGAGADSQGEPGAFNAEGGESPGEQSRTGEGVDPGEQQATSDDSMANDAAARFARALRDGDLEGARDAVRSMRESIERMTPEERERLARQLEGLADGLGDVDGSNADPSPEAGESGDSPEPAARENRPDEAENAGRPQAPPGSPAEPPDEPRSQPTEQSPPSPTQPGEPSPPSEQPEAPRAADQGENSPADAQRTQELQERGLSEDAARDVARETDPETIRERIEREGVDPPTAEREAREIAQENRERESQQAGEQRARERARDIGESLREAARAIERDEQSRRPEPPPQPQPTPDQPAREQPGPEQPSDPQPGEPRPQQPESRQTQPGQGQPAQQQPAQEQPGQAQPGQQPTSQPQPARQAPDPQQPGWQQPSPRRDPASGEPGPSEPGSEQPGTEQTRPPNPQPTPQQPTSRPGQPTPPEQPPTQGQEPGQRPAERTIDRPTEPTDQTGAESGDAQSRRTGTSEPATERDEPNESAADESGRDATPRDIDRALDALERNLDRVGDLQRRAAEDLDDARRLRDAADRLLDRTTPEQRERLSRLQRELAERQRAAQRPPSTEPTRFESVDASRPDDSAREQIISEWLGEPGEMTADPAARQEALGARVREAAAGAERAVEAQEVPSRYSDLIRRVFRRYAERAGEPPRAEDAPDAGP
ncbi:MAG: hypothetical protein KDA05_08765, partial [Phycisphaerales bacterium]|nr:hypothetical protein [Phycisphaerales bacterium]